MSSYVHVSEYRHANTQIPYQEGIAFNIVCSSSSFVAQFDEPSKYLSIPYITGYTRLDIVYGNHEPSQFVT